MKPLVEQVKEKYAGKVPFDEIDLGIEDNTAIADKYAVLYVPTLIFISKDGSVAGKLVGVAKLATIEEDIGKITK